VGRNNNVGGYSVTDISEENTVFIFSDSEVPKECHGWTGRRNKRYSVTGSRLAGRFGGPNTQDCGGTIRGGDSEISSSSVTSVNVRQIETLEVCGDQNESERKRRHWNLNEGHGL